MGCMSNEVDYMNKFFFFEYVFALNTEINGFPKMTFSEILEV